MSKQQSLVCSAVIAALGEVHSEKLAFEPLRRRSAEILGRITRRQQTRVGRKHLDEALRILGERGIVIELKHKGVRLIEFARVNNGSTHEY